MGARVARPRERQSLAPAEQGSNFLLAGSTGYSGRVTMPRGLELVRQCTWQQSWSIWPPRSWSWLAMLPGTIRSLASSQGISSLPSGVEQASGWGYHCTGWCLAQHPGCVASQEECKLEGEGLVLVYFLHYVNKCTNLSIK